MLRLGPLALLGIFLFTIASLTGSPPEDPKFNNALSVQAAMVRARTLLTEQEAKKAVEVLEEQLPKVNGNPQYLALLRDCYRAYIRDLLLAGQPAQAQRYLERLCILDPAAANDATLKPQVAAPTPLKFEVEAAKDDKPALPQFRLPKLPNLFAKKEETNPGLLPKPTVRAHAEASIGEDPFAPKFQRETPGDPSKARELLTRGASEFKVARYGEARRCFEQAYVADRTTLDSCKEQWAYCIIKGVTEAMDQPGMLPTKLPQLQKEVEGAIAMAPTKMMAVGQELLQTLEQRAKVSDMAPLVMGNVVKVRHMGPNKEGWQVARTPYFMIFHKQNNEFAERAAQVAESTRAAMYRKWFEGDGGEWEPQCELILHPNGDSYTQMTGVPVNSPGHSRIESDPSGRVITRRMDLRLDIKGMMEAVLPHEATHVVLAGMFGANHVPRWADEGIAVLSEPETKIDLHRRNLLKNHADGHLFGLKELMELKDYPHPRRIGAFYAQSVVLVEWLTQQRGPKVFTDFVRDGLRQGYDVALQRHYNMTFTQLDAMWQKQVISNVERYSGVK